MSVSKTTISLQSWAPADSRDVVKVFAITSASPGTGQTALAINLAQRISQTGANVVLFDANPGAGGVSEQLGLQPEYSLQDVLQGSKRIDDVTVTGPDGVRIVIAGPACSKTLDFDPMQCAALVRAFSDFDSPVGVLVIDVALEAGDCAASLCRAADEILVTLRNCPEDISAAAALVGSLHARQGITDFRIIPVQVLSASEAALIHAQLLRHFTSNLDIRISCCGYVPSDAQMSDAIRLQQSLATLNPRSRASLALKNIAQRLMQRRRIPAAAGHLEFFVERKIHNQNIN